MLTGETPSYQGVKPRASFDPAKGTWGAFELTGRYAELSVDKKAFPTYADITKAAQRARSWTGGINWYLNTNTKLTTNYDYTSFIGGAAQGTSRQAERAILSQVQVAF